MDIKNLINQLPDRQVLKKKCKALAVLDWIICGQEFETYHRFFKSNQEEYEGEEAQIGFDFEDEEGTSLHIYFTDKSCLIVPSESNLSQGVDNKAFEKRIPKEFQAFYKKNYENQDIPFVVYSVNNEPWKYEENFEIEGTEEEYHNFNHLQADADFYHDWAMNFFGDETFLKKDADLQSITNIFEGKTLTENIVLSIVEKVADWTDLEKALNELPYRFDF